MCRKAPCNLQWPQGGLLLSRWFPRGYSLNRLPTLSVMTNGKVTHSITRHDLLRAWIGLGMDFEPIGPKQSEELSLNVPYAHSDSPSLKC